MIDPFGVQHVVARIYDSKRAEVYERMGIPSVATVPWTVNRLMRELLSVKVSEMWREPTGQVVLMRLTVTESWVGRKLEELEAGDELLFVAHADVEEELQRVLSPSGAPGLL